MRFVSCQLFVESFAGLIWITGLLIEMIELSKLTELIGLIRLLVD